MGATGYWFGNYRRRNADGSGGSEAQGLAETVESVINGAQKHGDAEPIWHLSDAIDRLSREQHAA